MIGGQDDKILREMHAFAIEYVKLIVAKADELSQSQGCLEAKSDQPCQLDVEQVIRKAALVINNRFLAPQVGQTEMTRALQASDARQVNIERHAIAQPTQQDQQGRPGPAEVSSGPEGPDKRSRRARFRYRLNWHLFVSCFSNCLPRTLVETMPSNLGAQATNQKRYECQQGSP